MFPHIKFDCVKYPNLQQQNNNKDCGVYAIAFITSKLYGLEPETINYNRLFLREHILRIYKTGEIRHFPQILDGSEKKIVPLKNSLH